jgi:hypothetical protein
LKINLRKHRFPIKLGGFLLFPDLSLLYFSIIFIVNPVFEEVYSPHY